MPASLRRQKEIAQALTLLAPRVPFYDAEQIRAAATAPHLRALSAQNAVRLALLAYIRHSYTDYDQLRDDGLDKGTALYWIRDQITEKLEMWSVINLLPDSNYSDQ